MRNILMSRVIFLYNIHLIFAFSRFPLLKYIEVLSVLFQLDEDIKLHFIRTLEVQYGVDTSKNPENNLITDAWDAMQRTVRKVTSNVTLPT